MTLDVFAPELRQSLSRGTSSRPSARKKHRSLKTARNARLLRKKNASMEDQTRDLHPQVQVGQQIIVTLIHLIHYLIRAYKKN
jgi:hypothetical protein